MNFVLFGAAGYVAPRHLKAIKEIGGNLLAVCDPHDSVGIIDSYFPDCKYFKEFERLDRYCYKLLFEGKQIDYVSIASPNFLHDAHCRWALRLGANAICEKPLVLFEKNLDALVSLEEHTGKKVHGLYQLRYHPETQKIKANLKPYNKVVINYQTPRGSWYDYSWKGHIGKSGGLETNIGCHLFDLCVYLFGPPTNNSFHRGNNRESYGVMHFENAEVDWTLSTERGKPKRQFLVNSKPYLFDSGFGDLHTIVYQAIIDGKAFPIEDARHSIRICEEIRAKKYA
jgi:UDP-N-acetyl-2-amino-2-deoxyglucuronate dehydrogenase